MKIYPAIDLMDGRVVRLKKGLFDQKTTYSDDPLAVAAGFREEGAEYLHVVDLDGARDGKARQTDLIRRLTAESGLRVQTGGGIRTPQQAVALQEAGVERVVLGSIAVRDPGATREIIAAVGPAAVTLGLDIGLDDQGRPRVATHGWQEVSGTRAEELLDQWAATGITDVLCTDISRDGMLTGPNTELYARLAKDYPDLCFLASGGVSAAEEIPRLARAGAGGVIIGKALYEGRFRLQEVL